jgi:hypothetical protein
MILMEGWHLPFFLRKMAFVLQDKGACRSGWWHPWPVSRSRQKKRYPACRISPGRWLSSIAAIDRRAIFFIKNEAIRPLRKAYATLLPLTLGASD